MALALPILLIMISGLIEFGFALNQYLNALDAAREAARFATDGDPLERDYDSPGVTDTNCGGTLDFYMQAACIAQQTMSPVDFNSTTDDVVISVFRVLSSTVIGRWPNCEPASPDDCPNDPSPFADVMGEWHLYGRGSGCDGIFDDDGDGIIDDGCGPIGALGDSEFCNPNTQEECHPSRLDADFVEARLDPDAPDSAVLVVEVFYDYPHVLQLPWITPFVPNPLPLHTYTILPLPAAEPSLTITGTVTLTDGTPLSGVTINLNNGMIAITDSEGQYVRTGLASQSYTLDVDLSGTNCDVVFPDPASVTLGIENVYNVNFVVSDCIDVAATEAAASTQTQGAIETATFSAEQTATTVVEQTATAEFNQTATAEAGSTATDPAPPTETATVDPTCDENVISPSFSAVSVTGAENVLADGSSTIEVLVTVLNQCNNSANMAGKTVTLSSSRGGSDAISPASTSTDGSGLATFTVSSSLMSDWSSVHHDFSPSTFSAIADGVSITDVATGAFMCVGGVPGDNPHSDEVVWRYTNDTGVTRRLIKLLVAWTLPSTPSNEITEVVYDGISVWTGTNFSDNPATIDSGWLGTHDRHIDPGQSLDIGLVLNNPFAPSNSFSMIATWDNGSGVSTCESLPVTVDR